MGTNITPVTASALALDRVLPGYSTADGTDADLKCVG